MSLFSGIKFSSDKAKSLASEHATSAPTANSDGGCGSKPAPPTVSNPLLTASHAPKNTALPSSSSSKPAASSAALQFAPRRPKPAAKPAKAVYSAPPTASAVVEAAPVLIVPPPAPAAAKKDEVVLDADGKPVVRAPAMTLAAAEKEKEREKKGEGRQQQPQQRRKRKKRKRQQQQMYHTFQPDEEYDPNRPNDLGEYQHYREQVRQERRARFMEAKRRKAAGEASDSSYDSDSSDDAPRRDAPMMFAPPKIYDAPSQPARRSPSPPRVREPPPATGEDAYARRAAMAATTGDDAYARRMAMTTATGDDAYARRAAMSQRPPAPPAPVRPPPSVPVRPPQPVSAPPPGPPAFRPPVSVAPPTTGTGFRPPPAHLLAGAPPPFRPPPSHLMFGAPRPPPPGGAPPFPPTMPAGLPSRPPAGVPGGLPPRPPAGLPSGPPPAPVPQYPDYQQQLQEKMRAAAAVAAKLQALTGTPARPPPPAEEDRSGTFAERMFRKWGHTEGKGLGVREDGITQALTAEHVVPQVDTSKMSKRQRAKARAAAANAKNRKWVQAPNARGRIVNANEDVRTKEDLEKYGEVSRVVCLTGVAEDPEEIAEDLSDDIGEECSKHGIVERVVLHLVEPPPPDPADGLRVFVVFSGVAGAWRATRELNGRFFAGQKIRARYFDEERFNSGERDGDF